MTSPIDPQNTDDLIDEAVIAVEDGTLEEALPEEEANDALSALDDGDSDELLPEDLTEDFEGDDELMDVGPAQVAPVLEGEAKTRAQLRVIEALLFAASAPMDVATLQRHLARGPLGEGADIRALVSQLREEYAVRGVELVEAGGRFSLRTAPDLADYLRHETVKPVKLSRAMAETLAVIAYHQPVTRVEIENIRGVATSKGILDYLMQYGWVRPGRRRETPGRPLTWITTPAFLDHFGLSTTNDLPGMEELRAAGLLEAQSGPTYGVVAPSEDAELPPPVDASFESEPEFLPSEETVLANLEDETPESESASENETVESDLPESESNDDDAVSEDMSSESGVVVIESIESEALVVSEADDIEDSDDDDDDFDDDDDDFDDEDDDFVDEDEDDDEEAVLNEETVSEDELEPV